MADVNGAADAAAVTATPAQQEGSAPKVDTSSATDGHDRPFINKAEFVEMAKLVRSLKDEVASLRAPRTQEPKSNGKAPSEVDALRAELVFRDVVAEVAPHLDRAKRERPQRLMPSEQPQDLGAWVRGEVTALGWEKPAGTTPSTPTPPKPVEQAKQATNPGARGVGGQSIDPTTLSRDQWTALTGRAAREAFDGLVNRDPTVGNRFAPRGKP